MSQLPETPVLDGLRAVPGGFGQPTFAAFLDALLGAVRARAAARAAPPTLFLMGEPLAGKTTLLSQLVMRLTAGEPADAAGHAARPVIRPYLLRWGDAIRAAKTRGLVAPERPFGDLTPEEFGRTSQLVAEEAAEAGQATRGDGPALVVVEAPGITALTTPSGALRGIDRGYTVARALARHQDGYLLALAADQRVRDAHLGARGAAGALDVREATQHAANRIRQLVTDLLFELASDGAIRLPEPLPVEPLTRASLDEHPAYRNAAVLRAYLPYLFERDLGVPPERAFIGLNGYLGAGVAADAALLDRYDWLRARYDI